MREDFPPYNPINESNSQYSPTLPTRMSSLFSKLIFNPNTASKRRRVHLTYNNRLWLASQNNKMSSINQKKRNPQPFPSISPNLETWYKASFHRTLNKTPHLCYQTCLKNETHLFFHLLVLILFINITLFHPSKNRAEWFHFSWNVQLPSYRTISFIKRSIISWLSFMWGICFFKY